MGHQEQIAAITDELTNAIQSVVETFEPYRADHRPDFFGLEVGRAVDLMIPQHLAAALTRTPFDEDTTWLNVVIRLKPGVSISAATAGLRGVQPQIRAASFPRERR